MFVAVLSKKLLKQVIDAMSSFARIEKLATTQLYPSLAAIVASDDDSILDLLKEVLVQVAVIEVIAECREGSDVLTMSLKHKPDLLFLDEPTAGLDPVTARMIKNIILDLKRQGKTIFLTTHNMHDADELCDRVAFIVKGELKLIGAPTALKVQHGQKIVEVKTVANGGRNASKSYEFALDSLATDKAFMDLLQRETIESIHSKEATLEEVFIRTTGLQLT